MRFVGIAEDERRSGKDLTQVAGEIGIGLHQPEPVFGRQPAIAVDLSGVWRDGNGNQYLLQQMRERVTIAPISGIYAGIGDEVAAITARAMNGEIAFEPALRERVALLKDLPLGVIDDVIATRITLMPGGRELIATMKRHGAYTALVSGGFTAFASRIAETLGFDEHRANVLEHADGRLTGRVLEPILGKQAKLETLEALATHHGITPEEAMAVGDGANDLAMLERAGSGVALHAKPSVAARARMVIDHGDLTALLYIQGYRREDFAA